MERNLFIFLSTATNEIRTLCVLCVCEEIDDDADDGNDDEQNPITISEKNYQLLQPLRPAIDCSDWREGN